MFVGNATDTFDALLRNNVFGFRKRIINIDNGKIKCLYNCTDIINGPMWTSCAE